MGLKMGSKKELKKELKSLLEEIERLRDEILLKASDYNGLDLSETAAELLEEIL